MLHHSRRKVREALASPEPRPYTRRKEVLSPKLGPFQAMIDAILKADEEAPRNPPEPESNPLPDKQ